MEEGLKKLLITIGILIFIALFFTFNRMFKSNGNYKSQIKKLEKSLISFGEKYENFLPEKRGEVITIPLMTLKQSGYIDEEFRNPKTKEKFSNQLLMKITKLKKGYQYEILDTDENIVKDYDDVNVKAPMVALKGNEVEYAQLNEEYKDLGYIGFTASGKKADEVKISIEKNGKPVTHIDTSKLETYQITYHISYAKEDSMITRTVIVRDSIKPEVEMDRLIVKPEEVETLDLMKGVKIKDNSNQEVTVKTSGSLSSIVGKYVITYQVSDSSFNTTEKKRIIRVEENVSDDEEK